MALILNIDTATEIGSVCLSLNGQILAYSESKTQKEHATFLHKAIQQVMSNSGKALTELNAVSVTVGPGSYTGLRVSMAAAKGICYSLSIPFIGINTLKVMAQAAKQIYSNCFFCPMIDAKRMEVFTALFSDNLDELIATKAVIVDETFLKEYNLQKVVFIGSGIAKFKLLTNNPFFIFYNGNADARHLVQLSEQHYFESKFSDIAYEQPYYSKEFFTIK